MEREGSEMYFSSTRTHEAFELSLCLLSISGAHTKSARDVKKKKKKKRGEMLWHKISGLHSK